MTVESTLTARQRQGTASCSGVTLAARTGVTPIFLFSIARSGSTLVQRIIGSYPEVATVSEPWLLLPLVYMFRRRGVFAEYVQPLMASALEDFCDELPGGRADFDAELRRFVTKLYERCTGSQHRYFLDKSPPYFCIVDEIFQIFPDAKFIFLWRNPLAVGASLADWPDHAWGASLYSENLFEGLAKLIRAYQRNSDKAFAVRFEDLVSGDACTWHALMSYLDMPFRPESLHEFTGVQLTGRMGDKNGTALYGQISAEPLTKWRTTLSNPLRKEAARRYLSWIGKERLALMGYDARVLHEELDASPAGTDNLAKDTANLVRVLLGEPRWRLLRRRTNVAGPSSLRYVLGARRRDL
jgi:hypothetical protein